MKTVATYHRIEREREDFPDHAQLVDVIHLRGWDHVRRYHDYVDAGERPGLAELVRDASLGHFDIVLAQRAELVYRNPREIELFIDQLDEYSVDVAFVQKYQRKSDAVHRPGRRPREFDVEYARRLFVHRKMRIADIAAKLGVGYGTVHRALHAKPPATQVQAPAGAGELQLELGLVH